MIDTLLAACEKQKEKIPFGPADIKRSFVALVSRGLITREEVDKEPQWQVTVYTGMLTHLNLTHYSGMLTHV